MNDTLTQKQAAIIKNRVIWMRSGHHPQKFVDWWTANTDALVRFGQTKLNKLTKGEASIIISYLFDDNWDEVMEIFNRYLKE